MERLLPLMASRAFLDLKISINFLDFGDSAMTARVILAKPQKCASLLKNVAILPLLYRRAFQLTLTFNPNNLAVKNIILKNFKLLQNDPETATIFSQPPLSSYNISNFLVRSALKTDRQPGNFQCARARCKTCPFNLNTDRISGPKRSIQVTDISRVPQLMLSVYCLTCTFCQKLYIGETGRRLGHRFREHLRDVEKDDKGASKPVPRHFNLPQHSTSHMATCGLSLFNGGTESRKNLEQRLTFQIGTLNLHGINKRFSFN